MSNRATQQLDIPPSGERTAVPQGLSSRTCFGISWMLKQVQHDSGRVETGFIIRNGDRLLRPAFCRTRNDSTLYGT